MVVLNDLHFAITRISGQSRRVCCNLMVRMLEERMVILSVFRHKVTVA